MDISARMRQILLVLLQEEGPISVKLLAEQIGVSKRTAQRELEYMESTLKAYEVRFSSKTGVGVWLEGSEEEKKRLLAELSQGNPYDVSNREERRKRLVLELLREKGLKKLYYYSSQFGVSEATVSADLEAVESWLTGYGLQISRKPGSGIETNGSEEDYRRAIRAFIEENIDTKVLREAYEEETTVLDPQDLLLKSEIGQVLNNDVLKRVIRCIAGMDHLQVKSLTENSYVGLVIHITIAIDRILKDETIEPGSSWGEQLERDEDYLLSEEIAAELEEEFGIRFPTMEISYICLHIKGAKHERIRWNAGEALTIENRELQYLVNEMIDAFDPVQACLLKQDEEFIQGLLAHLQPTLIRIIYGMHIQNPMLAEIRESYPEIYRKCVHVAEVLEKKTQREVPEEEIGFLTVHFGAAVFRLEGRRENIRKVHAGVICSSGIGISRLMVSKLEKTYKDRMVLTAYGKNDITPYIIGKTDFLISTIPMDPQDIPVVSVNPLLNKENMEEVREKILRYERMPEKHKEENEFSVKLEEINLVAVQIKTILKNMEFFKVDNDITFEELLIAVGEKMSPYSDRSGQIQEDLMRRERISSQVFAEFGFALLHTRTKGVLRPEFAVCMTKDLEAFQDPYFKGIRTVIIMLVPIDGNGQINNEIMGYISSMLIEEYEFLEVLARGDKEEIRELLSRYLKEYFNRYLAKV